MIVLLVTAGMRLPGGLAAQLFVCVLVAGCGATSESAQKPAQVVGEAHCAIPPSSYAPGDYLGPTLYTAWQRPYEPPIGWRPAVERTLAGMGSFRTRFGQPSIEPSEMKGHPPHLRMQVRVDQHEDPRRASEVMWAGALLLGAVSELMGPDVDVPDVLDGDAWDVLNGADFQAVRPDGSSAGPIRGGMGSIALSQRYSGELFSDDLIARCVTDALQKHGLHVETLEVLHPLGPAPRVIVSTDDPKSVISGSVRYAIVKDAFGIPPRYEGYYLEVRDENGKPAAMNLASFRTGLGSAWASEELGGYNGGTGMPMERLVTDGP